MAAPLSEEGRFSAGTPQPLFRTSIRLNPLASQYAVSADGQRFLAVIPTREYESENFRVLLNWQQSVAATTNRCLSLRVSASVPTRCARRWARVGWGRSTRLETRGWSAQSR